VDTLMNDIAFGESPRWHDGRLWFADWGASEIIALDLDGASEVVVRAEFPSFPMCFDWLPDGRLLIVSAREGRLVRREADGSLVTHADLRPLCPAGYPWNEIVVDGRGNAYVNNAGFDFPGGDFAPGMIAMLSPDGSLGQVAGGVAFPNGMALTADGSTLLCAESYGKCLTAFDVATDGGLSNQRVWADLGDGVPDGICVDAAGAVWYGDVPNQRCVRVAEGGEILAEIELDRGCFACALGGPDGRTLFMIATRWTGTGSMAGGERTGQVLSARVEVRGIAPF
jgi:sugar lactone lactonase YvrE